VSEPATRLAVRVERGDFRLEVDAGWDERVAVVFGPSGSGKTTLFQAVLGLLPGARPRVRLGGTWLEDPGRGLRLPPERRGLGWVPQDACLFPHLSVRHNLRFGRARAGAGGEAALERAVEVLGLGALLERRVDELSGGERQRVAIGRALASGPRALLLDEPLAALDLPLRARVLPYLLRVRDELDLPILYITHDPDEAMLVGDVALVLEAGRVIAAGPPRPVLWSRAVLPLAEALGIENVVDAVVVASGAGDSTIRSAAGLELVIPSSLPLGERVRAGVPAHDLILAAEPPGRISARNVFEARVAAVEERGDDALVHLDAGERWVAKLTPAAVAKLGIRPGASLRVVIKAQAIRRLA
jgi:molybdate transport system ATP-binding protein